MKHLSLVVALASFLASTAACVVEEGESPTDLDEAAEPTALSEASQEVGRGWFSLEQDGIGTASNSNAAGLYQELYVSYNSQGYGSAVGYTQRVTNSASVNHVTFLLRIDCADGQTFYNSGAYVVDRQTLYYSLATPRCARYVRVVKSYFAMYVDN